MLSEFVRVAEVGEIAPNTMAGYEVGDEEILLVRIEDDYYALQGWCSHAEGLLADGYLDPAACEVECPIHEGVFDVRTGEAVNFPAEVAVQVFAVETRDGGIFVGPSR